MKSVSAVKGCGSDCESGVLVRVMGVDLVCCSDGQTRVRDGRWHESREAAFSAAKVDAEYRRVSGNPSRVSEWLKQQKPSVFKALIERMSLIRTGRDGPVQSSINAAYGLRNNRWVGPPESVVRAMDVATDGKWRFLSPAEEHQYFIS